MDGLIYVIICIYIITTLIYIMYYWQFIIILIYDTFRYVYKINLSILLYIPKKMYMTYKKRIIMKEIKKKKTYIKYYNFVKDEVDRYNFKQLRKWEKK